MRGEIMGQRDLLIVIAAAFNAHRLPYLLSGSFASSYYGYPRATHDIDFVVEVGREKLKPLEVVLQGLGKEFALTAKQLDTVSIPQMVSSYHAETAIKIDFWITDAADFSIKYMRRKFMTVSNVRISLISPEDLILTKLTWCKDIRSDRHMQDCVGIWRIQKGKLDEAYLHRRASELSVTQLFDEITSATPQLT